MPGPRVRGLLLLSLLVVVVALPAAAQRRRAVASGPAGSPPVTGQCHTYGYPPAGMKATYLSTTAQGNVSFTINYISSNATQTKTTQQVTTPQGNADVETTVDTEVAGALMATKRILTASSIVVPVLGKLTTEVEITFTPSMVIGPSGGWCQGAKWNIPAVNQTVITRAPMAPPQTQMATTVASEGEVLAVGESLTVPAGTFQALRYRGVVYANDTISPAITWMSMQHNITLRQDTLDANGNVTSKTELTALQLP